MGKKICILFLILFSTYLLLSACTNSTSGTVYPSLVPQSTVDKQKIVLTATETAISEMLTSTPIITATPVIAESKSIDETIKALYPALSGQKCTLDILKTDSIRHEKPVLQLKVIAKDLISKNIVSEIAFNPSHTTMAFVAYKSQEQAEEQIYLKSVDTGIVTEVYWSTRSDYRPVGNIIWVGDNQLAFMEQTGITITRIAVIDLTKKVFVLFWENYNDCEE